MKIRLISPHHGKIWLVDWRGLLPYWKLSWQYETAALTIMKPLYHTGWFGRHKGEIRFKLGHIWFDGRWIMFTNGTHRTRVLALGDSPIIPITAHAETYKNKLMAPYFIRRLGPDEIVDIPDFPVTDPVSIREAV